MDAPQTQDAHSDITDCANLQQYSMPKHSQPLTMATSMTDLPTEILLRICEFLQPLTMEDILPLSESLLYYHPHQCPLSVSSDLNHLGASCRRWNTIIESSVPPCFFYNSRSPVSLCDDPYEPFVNQSGQRFRETLWSLARPELVTHLHLTWRKPALLDLEVLTEPFPALKMLEIANVRYRDWQGLMKTLARMPMLQMLSVEFAAVDMDPNVFPEHEIKMPAADEKLLRQVRKLCVLDEGFSGDVKVFLEWFPQVDDLTLNTEALGGPQLSATLQTCRNTLEVLKLDQIAWPRNHRLDLRPLRILERFDIRIDLPLEANAFHDLRLPSSVHKITYTGRRPERKRDVGPEEEEALQYMARKRTEVAPGLQSVVLRVPVAWKSNERLWQSALLREFSKTGVVVIVEFVTQNLSWECTSRGFL